MIDAYFVNGPWDDEVRSYADPPEYIELDGGEYARTQITATADARYFYAWISLDPIQRFASEVERVAYENGFHDGMARDVS